MILIFKKCVEPNCMKSKGYTFSGVFIEEGGGTMQ